uniref:Putative secreted protein n=1 Tax=Anopheles darlingi TaxID=43151 RepID=A0A2M4D6Y8_ANODA
MPLSSCFMASTCAMSVLLLLVDHSVMVWAISVRVSVVSSLFVPEENFSVSELLNGSYRGPPLSDTFSSENRF